MIRTQTTVFSLNKGVLQWVLFLLLLIPLSSESQEGIVQENFTAMVEETLEKRDLPGMALSIIQEGELLYSYNNMGSDSRFHIASLTKSFTALGIMQLAEEGYLSLDQDFRDYLPWFDLRHHRDTHISVRSLLNMSSGFPASYGNRWTHGHHTLKEEVESLQAMRLESFPEEQTNYNNVNYLILGAIIEEITSMSFEAYTLKSIIDPLEMKDTDFQNQGIAQGHRSLFFWHVPTRVEYLNNHTSDAGIVSTQQDMNKYLAALLNPEIMEQRGVLSLPYLEEFFSLVSTVPDENGRHYAMGFWQTRIGDQIAYEADCAYPRGFHGKMLFIPHSKMGAYYISNTISVISESYTGDLLENMLRMAVGMEVQESTSDHSLTIILGLLFTLILQQWLRFGFLMKRVKKGSFLARKRKIFWKLILPSILDLFMFFMGMMGFAILFHIGPWTMANMILDIYILLRILSLSAFFSLGLRFMVLRRENKLYKGITG